MFNDAEFRNPDSQDELQFLELKPTWHRSGDIPNQVKSLAVRDEAAETVAAFATADGRLLLARGDDDGTLAGHGHREETIDDFVSIPRRGPRPSSSCRADRLRIAAVEVLVSGRYPNSDALPLSVGFDTHSIAVSSTRKALADVSTTSPSERQTNRANVRNEPGIAHAVWLRREQGPFPRCLRANKLTVERSNMVRMRSAEKYTFRYRARTEHP